MPRVYRQNLKIFIDKVLKVDCFKTADLDLFLLNFVLTVIVLVRLPLLQAISQLNQIYRNKDLFWL